MLNKKMLDYIAYYQQLGFSPIPVVRNSKRINLPNWDLSQPITNTDIQQWIQEDRYQNIGLLVGAPSSNLTIIDIDEPKYFPLEKLEELLTFDNQKIGFLVKTGKGYQLYFKNKQQGWDTNYKSKEFKIEFFTEKHIVVAPPSIHPNGSEYRFLIKPDYFKPINAVNIFTGLKAYCNTHSPDYILKDIMNPLKKQEIIDHLYNPECTHNSRLWIVGFLYSTLGLDQTEILSFIDEHNRWEDYKKSKTEYFILHLLRYIDHKVGEDGGCNVG